MILMLLALFHQTALGLQVAIEELRPFGRKCATVIAVRLGCYGLAVTGIVAVLRIAFSA